MYTRRMLFRRDNPKEKNNKDSEEEHPAKAVALGYDAEKDHAPRVLASGKGLVAEQIIALAKANNIPVREDPILAAALSNVAVDTMIPPELYAVVAEVLAYVYRIRNRKIKTGQ